MPHSAAVAQKKIPTVFGIYFKTRYFIKGNPVKLHIKVPAPRYALFAAKTAFLCVLSSVISIIKAKPVAGLAAPWEAV